MKGILTEPLHVLYKDLFTDLASTAIEAFQAIQLTGSYGPGAVLFAEDQMASGIFLIQTGRVKLFAPSVDASSIQARMAGPGEILGVAEAMAASAYRAAAQTAEPSRISFISREDFGYFLSHQRSVAFRLVQLLSSDLSGTLERLRTTLARSHWEN